MLKYFPKVAAVLRTFGVSTNLAGKWSAGPATDSDVLILRPQPAVGADLLWMPENDRKLAHFYTWTESPIDIHDCTDRVDADRIIYKGRVHLIVKSEDWEAGEFREILMRQLPGVTP